jgi:hypothetical protein
MHICLHCVESNSRYVGFGVLTAVTLKAAVIKVGNPCTSLERSHVSEVFITSIFRVEE